LTITSHEQHSARLGDNPEFVDPVWRDPRDAGILPVLPTIVGSSIRQRFFLLRPKANEVLLLNAFRWRRYRIRQLVGRGWVIELVRQEFLRTTSASTTLLSYPVRVGCTLHAMLSKNHGHFSQATERPGVDVSPVHSMLETLELQTDAIKLNEIVNHPDIYPYFRGYDRGPLDLSAEFRMGDRICLLGKFGGFIFQRLQSGFFEANAQVWKGGRGAWALDCLRACLMWLFTHTDAMEVVARCPKGNLAAKALARAVGSASSLQHSGM